MDGQDCQLRSHVACWGCTSLLNAVTDRAACHVSRAHLQIVSMATKTQNEAGMCSCTAAADQQPVADVHRKQATDAARREQTEEGTHLHSHGGAVPDGAVYFAEGALPQQGPHLQILERLAVVCNADVMPSCAPYMRMSYHHVTSHGTSSSASLRAALCTQQAEQLGIEQNQHGSIQPCGVMSSSMATLSIWSTSHDDARQKCSSMSRNQSC